MWRVSRWRGCRRSRRRKSSGSGIRLPASRRDLSAETATSFVALSGRCGTRQGLLYATPKQAQTVLAEIPRKLHCAKSGGLIVSALKSRRLASIVLNRSVKFFQRRQLHANHEGLRGRFHVFQ